MTKDDLKKGKLVYWVRVVPRCQIFDVIDMKVRTVTDDYFTACYTEGLGQTQLFNFSDIDHIVFESRAEAIEICSDREEEWYNSHTKVALTASPEE